MKSQSKSSPSLGEDQRLVARNLDRRLTRWNTDDLYNEVGEALAKAIKAGTVCRELASIIGRGVE
jgi:hypothetical protein